VDEAPRHRVRYRASMLGSLTALSRFSPFGLLAAAAVALLSAHARAEDLPSIDARTWRPSTDPNAGLALDPVMTPGPWVWSASAFANYALRPVTLRGDGSRDAALRPLEHTLGVDAALNLGIGKRFAVGGVLPVLAYQDGSGALPPQVSSRSRVVSPALGDAGLSLKGTLVSNEQGGFGLATLGYVTLPTGNRGSFAGEGAPTASVRILAEYTLLIASVQASAGYKLRTQHRTWPDAASGGIRFGDEIPWSVGFSMRPGVLGIDPGNRQRLELAAHGWLPAGPVGPFGLGSRGSSALSPVLLALSDRIELGHYRDVFVMVGGEVGLTDAVGVPAFRGVLGLGWTPRSHDRDGDGVDDDFDGCPDIPEDKDGFEDQDGCPDIDDDDDGILDRDDACPREPGPASDVPSMNGCPRREPETPPSP
jgi:OOP family OmpA-OmpF porin